MLGRWNRSGHWFCCTNAFFSFVCDIEQACLAQIGTGHIVEIELPRLGLRFKAPCRGFYQIQEICRQPNILRLYSGLESLQALLSSLQSLSCVQIQYDEQLWNTIHNGKEHPHPLADWQTGKANSKGGLECLGFGGLCLTLILFRNVYVCSCRLNSLV